MTTRNCSFGFENISENFFSSNQNLLSKRRKTKAQLLLNSVRQDLSKMSSSTTRKLQVHRCRFAVCHPHGIHALALNGDGTRLAVGRTNGDIEIWNVEHAWYCVKKIAGSGQSTIQVLIWALVDGTERLFSAGLNARIIEWDLVKLRPLHASDSYGGAVWCGVLSPTQDQFCVGCEDGSLRIFDISPTDGPVYVRSVGRHDSRVLSLCWKSENQIVSGGADSTISTWAVPSCQNTCRITVEVLSEPTLVWAVTELADGNKTKT